MRISVSLRSQGIVILVLLVGLGLSFLVAFFGIGRQIGIEQTNAKVSRQTQVDAQRLETGMVNQETGIWGYRLSGDQQFLAPYVLGQQQVRDALAALQNETKGTPISAQLAGITESISTWQDWARGQTAAIDAGGPKVDLVAGDDGKALFDQFRRQSAGIQSTLQKRVTAADSRVRDQSIVLLSVLGLLVLAGVFVLGLFAFQFFMGGRRSHRDTGYSAVGRGRATRKLPRGLADLGYQAAGFGPGDGRGQRRS